ncbi:MAG: primosomal protein N' [Chlamydiia bacterium]|nr:primosomal protein N' [Chlamydiia bacterium]
MTAHTPLSPSNNTRRQWASVALEQSVGRPLDYEIPEELIGILAPGVRVEVPLRNKTCWGVIVALQSKPPSGHFTPKLILRVASDQPLLTPDLMKLAKWMASYYYTPLDQVMKVMLPSVVRKPQKETEVSFVKLALSRERAADLCRELRQKAPKQAEVLDILLEEKKGLLLSQLLEKNGGSRAPIDALYKKGAVSLERILRPEENHLEGDFFKTKKKTLNSEQEAALKPILAAVSDSRFEVHLLQGVTGSGKTEVYLQAIEHTLRQEKGVMLLVPEVALTAQTIDRFRARFDERVVTLHHRMTPKERLDAWHGLLSRKASLLIGARSAVFAPIPHLGLIIVDEEHESAYKESEKQPCYHARDIAVVRGKLTDSCVILGSATPSFESRANVEKGKYHLSRLTLRAGNAKPPTPIIIDMNAEKETQSGGLISSTLLKEIETTVNRGEQVILFLNRRGFFTSLFCRECGEAVGCPHCSTTLTFHRSASHLACHLCDYRLTPIPNQCPRCKNCETMKFRGIGTEQVETAIHRFFPNVRTLRMDGDTTRHKGSGEKILHAFRTGKADLLIGTQMIAKGHHFPNVTLVGILRADAGLSLPDFRASESLFQLLTQVSGRSGRGDLPGRVLIQTYSPSHRLIELASCGDFDTFYEEEVAARKEFGFPPWGQIVKCAFIGSNPKIVEDEGNRVRELLLETLPNTIQVYPLQPAGYAKVKGQFRFHFLIIGPEIAAVSCSLRQIDQKYTQNSQVKRLIDFHPSSTFF